MNSPAADTARRTRSVAASSSIVLRYLAFAAISTGANLLAQEAASRAAPGAPLAFAMLVGTAVGFAVKYVLDKRWIFQDPYTTRNEELRKVWYYGLFSVLTTLIFWGFEVAFWTVWGTNTAKYTGAVLGLSIGYALKFVLDRRFTFGEREG